MAVQASLSSRARTAGSSALRLVGLPNALAGTQGPKPIIRYLYYAFIFSVPLESTYVLGGRAATLSKLIGYLFVLATLLQPRLCFKRPPQAFWWFATYVLVHTIIGLLMLDAPGEGLPTYLMIPSLVTVIQLLVLFWVSYNLMISEPITKGTLLALVAGSILLAFLQSSGSSGVTIATSERVSTFGQNPNAEAGILSLGLLGLVGLAYGRKKEDLKGRLLFWLCSGVLAIAIVRTGSRGAVLALAMGLMVFFLKRTSLEAKLKLALIGMLAVGFLAFASYRIEPVRERWEKTFYEGDLAGRATIFSEAWEMFLERPFFGWGPVRNYFELGSRVGRPTRDPHNMYLWILTEAGLIGAIPFFVGLWLCWRSVWRGRWAAQGVLPMAMLVFLLAVNMKGTGHHEKVFWVVLAYALASSSYVVLSKRWKPTVSPRYAAPYRAQAAATSRLRKI